MFKKISQLILIIIFLNSCGTMQEAGKVLRNQKVNTTDEFLVKKKEPLIMPPDYKKIPEPDSISNKKTSDDEKIKELLNAPKKGSKTTGQSTTTEESILRNIRK